MAKPKTDISLIHLEQMAYNYIKDCMKYQKEQATASGKIVKVLDRQIPTIDYFLRIWIPEQGEPTINRSTYYRWLNDESNPEKCNTIKNIEQLFKALATDIVANEGKGIFYAKNRLGMTDRAMITNPFVEQPLFNDIEPITGMLIQ
ncbi:MAG: hypothetical protein KBE91_07300 [Bacteroidia bacterium]|nr:hypothetical protein [Chitinophagaceae bacterium]MBP9689399.1 hypothetical protein [Bacteroidia bacterium]